MIRIAKDIIAEAFRARRQPPTHTDGAGESAASITQRGPSPASGAAGQDDDSSMTTTAELQADGAP